MPANRRDFLKAAAALASTFTPAPARASSTSQAYFTNTFGSPANVLATSSPRPIPSTPSTTRSPAEAGVAPPGAGASAANSADEAA